MLLDHGSFLLQGAWDVQAAQNRRLPPWFATLRAILTAGAVLALVAGLVDAAHRELDA
jgi:hypothetical protein